MSSCLVKTVTTINYGIIRNTTLPTITICPHYLDYRKLAMLNENISTLYEKYSKTLQNINREDINDRENNFFTYLKALEMFFETNFSNFNINKYILENFNTLYLPAKCYYIRCQALFSFPLR